MGAFCRRRAGRHDGSNTDFTTRCLENEAAEYVLPKSVGGEQGREGHPAAESDGVSEVKLVAYK